MGADGIAKLIAAASTSQLALAAFLSIAVAGIGYYFFRDTPVWARIVAFFAIIAFAFTLSLRLIAPANPSPTTDVKVSPLSPATDAKSAAPVTAPASIGGAWIDKDGDALVIMPGFGNRFTISRWSFDGFVAADGVVDGDAVRLHYVTRTLSGTCDGSLAADRRSITLACEEPGNRFAQTLRRGG